MSKTYRRKNCYLEYLIVTRWYLDCEEYTSSYRDHLVNKYGGLKNHLKRFHSDSGIEYNSDWVQNRGVVSNKKVRNEFKNKMSKNMKRFDYEDFDFTPIDQHKKLFNPR